MGGASYVRKHRGSASKYAVEARNVDDGLRGSQSSAAYRDFALVSAESIVKIVEPPKAKRKGPRGGVQTPFPNRLFDMLEEVHEEGLENIVSWQSHGRSFIVRKPAQFETRILPRYFSQTKMSSFQRQLNLYGFLRQNAGPDRGSYYHELFMRGRPDLPKIMVRTRVKGIGMGRTNKVEKEPDFYKMAPCLPDGNQSLRSSIPTTEALDGAPELVAANSLASGSTSSSRRGSTQPCQREMSPIVEPPAIRRASTQPWHAPVAAHTFRPVVTPMSDSRPVCRASSSSCAPMSARLLPPPPPQHHHHQQHAAYIARSSRVPSSSHHHTDGSLLAHPVRTISAQLPMIPLSDHFHQESNFYLQPRPTNETEIESWQDIALFEGLNFQVVDDDSLEQFESELISDGGSVSGSL